MTLSEYATRYLSTVDSEDIVMLSDVAGQIYALGRNYGVAHPDSAIPEIMSEPLARLFPLPTT